MEIDVQSARRLALHKAGLLKPEWLRSKWSRMARGNSNTARQAAHSVIDHFGYLQLDTVSIVGARSHALVLYSRLPQVDLQLAESLLQAGEPLFEYWGHEASWLPLDLYPYFEFRRQEFQRHPWWGDLIREHPRVVKNLRAQIRAEGPLRSLDMEGQGSSGWWDLKLSKKVASAMWSAGELAVLERRNFQRSFDFIENVIPADILAQQVNEADAIKALLLKALDGHGWATQSTLIQTWRFKNRARQVSALLKEMQEEGHVLSCDLIDSDGKRIKGWIQAQDLPLLPRLNRLRPRKDRSVLLSPFDPLLWDRQRVEQLFGFHQILEIFKPAAQRQYGYYCLPVLAGEHLVARYDLKAHKKQNQLQVLNQHDEDSAVLKQHAAAYRQASQQALMHYAQALGLSLY